MATPPVRPACLSAADRDELARDAAELGITPRRLLQELALIAFADMTRIAEWGPGQFKMKNSAELTPQDSAAIAELIATAGGNAVALVKLFDKRAALETLARHIGMYERAAARPKEVAAASDTPEDPRELIVRRLAALAAGAVEKRRDPEPEEEDGSQIPASVGGMGST